MDWIREEIAVAVQFLSTWTSVFCVWLAGIVLTMGYPGILFLMTVESSLVPFPSELVMPPAGYQIHEGNMAWAPVIAVGVAGSLIGAVFNYFLAAKLGRPFFIRYGKYFFLKPEHLERTERFFADHGEITTFVGRLIPVIRQLISLPAGLSKMPLGKFCMYTSLGAFIWIVVLTVIGWLVGRNQELLQYYMKNATMWVVGAAVGVVIVYIKIWGWKKKKRSEENGK